MALEMLIWSRKTQIKTLCSCATGLRVSEDPVKCELLRNELAAQKTKSLI